MTWSRSSSCERTRFLAALAPDRVLSETEERTLARHLDHCPSCSAFAASVAAFTTELRTAPLMTSAGGVRMAFSGARRRRRTSLRLPLVALTAAAAGVLMTSVVLHERPVRTALPSAPPRQIVNAGGEDDQVVFHRLRDVVHERQLMPDYRSDSPGIYLG
jgi:hypothetical protein